MNSKQYFLVILASIFLMNLLVMRISQAQWTKGGPEELFYSVPYPIWQNGKWGYARSGMQIIPSQFDLAGPFHGGVASVKKDNKWGYIDEKGILKIPLQFEVAASFSEGFAAVKKDGKWGYINTQGAVVINLQYDMADAFSEGLAAVERGGTWGYINTKGEQIIDFKYHAVSYFSEGLAAVEVNDKWGYIDASGRETISPKFDLAAPFSENMASFETGGKWGFVNGTGKEVIAPKYNAALPFSEGLSSVLTYHKGPEKHNMMQTAEFVDKKGQTILEYANVRIGSFSNGLAPLVEQNNTFLIDKAGEKVKEFPQSRVEVQLDSVPRGATVYMVPLYDWETNGEEKLLDNKSKLNRWRVPEGPTFLKTTAENKVYEVVFYLHKKKDHVPLDVSPGNPNRAKGNCK